MRQQVSSDIGDGLHNAIEDRLCAREKKSTTAYGSLECNWMPQNNSSKMRFSVKGVSYQDEDGQDNKVGTKPKRATLGSVEV